MSRKTETLIICGLFVLLTILYFADLPGVPFHPDESTFLYTSQDFESLFSAPLSLAWEPGQPDDALSRYRLLDEPLSRYVFGLARRIANIPPEDIDVDWDWSADWETNIRRGALPTLNTLRVARAASTALALGAALLLYLAARKIGNVRGAVVTLALFSLNGLTLLHGRRSMREGIMLFTIALLIWSFPRAVKHPWLTGAAMALALAARYSAAALLPAAYFSAVWEPLLSRKFRHFSLNSLYFSAAFLALFFLLQPVLWKNPVDGLGAMAEARLRFTEEGVELLEGIAPDLVLNGSGERFSFMVFQVFFAPPSFFEFGNYAQALSPSIEAYQDRPPLHIWRGALWGGLVLSLFLTALVLTGYRLIRQYPVPSGLILILAIASLSEFLFLLILVPTPFQRYYLPLLPFVCIWCGLAFVSWEQRLDTEVSSAGSASSPTS